MEAGHDAGLAARPGGNMNRTTRRALALLAVPLVVATAACGSGDDDAAESTTPTTEAPATTEAPPTEIAGIRSYSDVQPAVVQIVARGTFRDPEIGFADGSGLG